MPSWACPDELRCPVGSLSGQSWGVRPPCTKDFWEAEQHDFCWVSKESAGSQRPESPAHLFPTQPCYRLSVYPAQTPTAPQSIHREQCHSLAFLSPPHPSMCSHSNLLKPGSDRASVSPLPGGIRSPFPWHSRPSLSAHVWAAWREQKGGVPQGGVAVLSLDQMGAAGALNC